LTLGGTAFGGYSLCRADTFPSSHTDQLVATKINYSKRAGFPFLAAEHTDLCPRRRQAVVLGRACSVLYHLLSRKAFTVFSVIHSSFAQ
jgi:hypothetical protein